MNDINFAFNEFPILETDKFLLREVKENDYKEIYDIYCEEEVIKYQQIEPMQTLEQAQKSVNAFLNGFRNKKFIRWCIADKVHDKVIGLITLHDFDNWNSKAEIGYMLNKNYWKQGIMSEVSQEVICYAFKVIGLNRIEALIHPRNTASIKLSTKMGFIKEGLKKDAAYNKRTDEYEDRLIFGLLKSEYK